MELQLAMLKGSTPKKIEITSDLFEKPFNEALVHQVITAQMAARRSGTKGQKTRAEVRGGGIKPWRQKGTGRARAGTIRSPLWRGGGKVFAAKTRDFSQKVNKKMYRGALHSILSELFRLDRLHVIEELNLETPKTKVLLSHLQDLGYPEALILIADWNLNLFLSARNLLNVEIDLVSELDIMNLMQFEHVLITEAALRQFEEVLG